MYLTTDLDITNASISFAGHVRAYDGDLGPDAPGFHVPFSLTCIWRGDDPTAEITPHLSVHLDDAGGIVNPAMVHKLQAAVPRWWLNEVWEDYFRPIYDELETLATATQPHDERNDDTPEPGADIDPDDEAFRADAG
jgi:hypothetical protein